MEMPLVNSQFNHQGVKQVVRNHISTKHPSAKKTITNVTLMPAKGVSDFLGG